MIVELGPADVMWSFDDYDNSPSLRVASTKVRIDPTPGYAHEVDQIERTLPVVKTRAGQIPDIDVTVYVASYEALGRTNAWASKTHVDYDRETKTWVTEPIIFMSGKRIPPHPAMTRYLTAHEYGHHVQYLIEDRLGFEEYSSELLDRYGEVRDLEKPPYYGPGTWHRSRGEVFADDFRILVAGIEPEYWPHPGILPPLEHTEVGQWWEEIRTTDPKKWKLL